MAGNSLVDRFRIFRRAIIVGACAITARRRRSGAAIPTAGTAGARSGGPEGKQRRFLSLDEIGQLGAVLRDAGEEGIQSRLGLAAIRFLLLTGLRRMEALALPWEWVDTRARCIRFEDTKSGAQLRPIGSPAISLLDALPRSGASRFVFPAARGEGHFVGLPRVLARICRRASLSGVTVHVLRHSFAAAAAEMGFSELTIAGLLGHSVPGVTARYAHVPDRALLAAADQVSRRIDAALAGETDADVIELDPHWART
jgi:integrase